MSVIGNSKHVLMMKHVSVTLCAEAQSGSTGSRGLLASLSCAHLYSVLVQVQPPCQLLPQLDTWVTVHLEHRLQHVHLHADQHTGPSHVPELSAEPKTSLRDPSLPPAH